MLTESEFIVRYGVPRAMSVIGCMWVGSAILKNGTYVYFDNALGSYR